MRLGLRLSLLFIFLIFILYPILFVLAAGIDSVNLVSPGNDTWTNQDNNTITFTFNYTGDNATASCIFYITNSTNDFVAVGENSSVLNVTNTDIQSNASIAEGTRQWYVNCTNSTTVQSEIWTLKVDITNPVPTIVVPGNMSYNYDPELNFSYVETNPDSCWYDLNGTGNVTLASCDTNGTSLTSSEGGNNVRLCMNDSAGSEGCDQVYYTKDTISPVIENVTSTSVTWSSATITWDTIESSNSTVYYGTSPGSLTQTSSSASLVTEHSIGLTSLSSETLYYYNVSSCDQLGNCNNSGTYNFTTLVCPESWSCTDWSMCTGGIQTRTCTDSNNCGTTTNKPAESQYCISLGGTPKPKPEKPPEVRKSWSVITPDVEASMSVNKSGLDFTEIRISVKNQANQVSMTVTKLEDKPADIEKEVAGKVYQYVQIQKSNLEDENIEKSVIKFKVSKTWVSDNNINKLTVTLNRYTTEWSKLTTSLVNEDDTYIYYEAETPGFSVFAVTGEELTCTPDSKRCLVNDLQKCKSDGTGWEAIETCEYGCDSESLSCRSKERVCEPDSMKCSDNLLQRCSSDGYTWETIETCEYQCLGNKCVEAPEYDYTWVYIGVAVIVVVILLLIAKKSKLHKKWKFKLFKKK